MSIRAWIGGKEGSAREWSVLECPSLCLFAQASAHDLMRVSEEHGSSLRDRSSDEVLHRVVASALALVCLMPDDHCFCLFVHHPLDGSLHTAKVGGGQALGVREEEEEEEEEGGLELGPERQ